MSVYTIFGGRGFIGSEIVAQLQALGHQTFVPERDDSRIFECELGTVIYCAGNGDCKNTPFSVLEANVILLSQLLQKAKFDKLIYISSTRVYMNQEESFEEADLTICADDSRRLFNLTKLVGEEICLKSNRPITIIRPSNVYGLALNSPLFLPAITRNAINNKRVDMYIAKEYAKDYVSVKDVASCCIELSQLEKVERKIVNVAAGFNVSAQEIADVLEKHTGCEIVWNQITFPRESFPETDISTLADLLPTYRPRNVLTDLEEMISDFNNVLSDSK